MTRRSIAALYAPLWWGMSLAFAGCAPLPSGGADAPPVERGSTLRCIASLHGPDGFSVAVPGWGSSASDAHRAAKESARYLAEVHQMSEGWPALFDPNHRHGASSSLWRHWHKASARDAQGTPGYQVSAGTCEPLVSAEAPGTQWSVTWAGLTTQGGSLSATVERSRRHACGRPFAKARHDALAATAIADPATRLAPFTAAMKGAYKAFETCMTDESALTFARSDTPAAPPSPQGTFACQGSLPTEPRKHGYPTPIGFGSSVEEAREATWRAWRRVTHRRGVGEALEALASASPSTRQAMLARAFERSARDVGPSIKFELALTPCGVVPQTPEALRWTWNPDPRLKCKAPEHAPPTLTPLEARDALCASASWAEASLIADAVAAAEPDVGARLFQAGWASVLSCESDCVHHATLPVTLSMPSIGFTDKAQLSPALSRALEAQDHDTLLALIPALSHPRAIQAFTEDGTRFFTKLAEAHAAGKLMATLAPTLLHGRWVLFPAQPKSSE